eukprot:4828981-Pleurochrysis_carterae.AAC.3
MRGVAQLSAGFREGRGGGHGDGRRGGGVSRHSRGRDMPRQEGSREAILAACAGQGQVAWVVQIVRARAWAILLGWGWRGGGRGRHVQNVRLWWLRRVDNRRVRIGSKSSCPVRGRRRGGLRWYRMEDGGSARFAQAREAQDTLADRSVEATATSGVGRPL